MVTPANVLRTYLFTSCSRDPVVIAGEIARRIDAYIRRCMDRDDSPDLTFALPEFTRGFQHDLLEGDHDLRDKVFVELKKIFSDAGYTVSHTKGSWSNGLCPPELHLQLPKAEDEDV